MSDNDRLKQIVELQDQNTALRARVGVLETGIRQLADDSKAIAGQAAIIAAEHRKGSKVRSVEKHYCDVIVLMHNRLAGLLDHTDTGSRDA